jgi:hypothetical protein
MSDDNLPRAVRSAELKIGPVALMVFTLDDGRRVIDEDGLNNLMEWLEAGGQVSDADLASFIAQYGSFLTKGRTS